MQNVCSTQWGWIYFFYVPCSYITEEIMAVHIFLSLILISMFLFLLIFRKTCSTIHLLKLNIYINRCFTQSIFPSNCPMCFRFSKPSILNTYSRIFKISLCLAWISFLFAFTLKPRACLHVQSMVSPASFCRTTWQFLHENSSSLWRLSSICYHIGL